MSTSDISLRTTAGRLGGVLVALALTLSMYATHALPAGAAPDAASGRDWAGGWIAGQVAADGSVPGFSGSADVGATVQAALGLAASGVGRDAFDRAADYVRDNYASYAQDDEGRDRPGALAYLILLADAADLDPTAFGGDEADNDLVTRLQDTRQTAGPDAGLYGTQNPSFDGVFRQSLSLLALDAAGAQPHESATDWLVAQQCPNAGFPAYRDAAQREAGTCDPQTTTPDTNSTAFAVQAARALGLDLTHDPLAFLAQAQNAEGGFGYTAGAATDTNSTALVIQALVASGQDPAGPLGSPWTQPDLDNPTRALLLLQLGCSAATGDRGAFAYQPDEDGSLSANAFATYQSTWGTARLPLPFGATQLAAQTPAPDCPDLSVVRRAGDTRIGTSVAVARASWPDGADTVVLADAYGYADALAGSTLAVQLDAPILLSDPQRLPDAVAAAVNDLGARRAVLLGGPGALSRQVGDDLRARTGVESVERVAGQNRFDTARRIADRVDADEVYVTEGDDPDPDRGWPDALAVSPLAAAEGRPILLVTTGTLPSETRRALQGVAKVTIVGGPGAVSPRVEDEIDEVAGEVVRVHGDTRYRTALAVARLSRDVFAPGVTWFATGRTYADALAAGPAAARVGAPVMLVDRDDLERSQATRTYVRELDEALRRFVVVGGTGAVSRGVVDQLRNEAR